MCMRKAVVRGSYQWSNSSCKLDTRNRDARLQGYASRSRVLGTKLHLLIHSQNCVGNKCFTRIKSKLLTLLCRPSISDLWDWRCRSRKQKILEWLRRAILRLVEKLQILVLAHTTQVFVVMRKCTDVWGLATSIVFATFVFAQLCSERKRMINFLHHIECIFGQIFFHVGISSLVTSQLMEVLTKSPIVPVVCSMQSCKRIP